MTTIGALTSNMMSEPQLAPLCLLSQDLIKEYFRSSIDDLKRERALFEGPPPLLLASMNVEDLCILLSGSDHNTSQVELGDGEGGRLMGGRGA